MRTVIALAVVSLVPVTIGSVLRAQAEMPAWAYAVAAPRAPGAAAAPAEPAEPDETALLRAAGSSHSFTLQQVDNSSGPADWFPEDHPSMPDIVAHGRRPDILACGFCHYPNGKGRPSNAPVADQPVEYFIQALNDFKNDVRKPAEPRKTNTDMMIAMAKALTPEEMRAAAEYFASVPWKPWIRVVETDTVPKTRAQGSIYYPLPGNETEPIGMRIIETPENVEQTHIRNPRSGFIAYAPVGSLSKGEALVTTGGNGRTVQCGICHGPNLGGLGKVPGIAGRSPSYLARQMYDIQVGARHGPDSALMQSVVAKLTNEDLVAIAAYVSSMMP
jgi:cytochrome c553